MVQQFSIYSAAMKNYGMVAVDSFGLYFKLIVLAFLSADHLLSPFFG